MNPNTTSGDGRSNASEQLLLSGTGVSAQKCKLVGYQVVFRKNDSGVDSIIPSQIFVNLDFIGGSQLHVASGRRVGTNTDYQHIHAIPLATADGLVTTNFGLNPIEFNIGQRINKHINIEVTRYDDNPNSSNYGRLIPISTDTAAALTTRYALPNDNPLQLVPGTVALQSLMLYFHYDFSSIF